MSSILLHCQFEFSQSKYFQMKKTIIIVTCVTSFLLGTWTYSSLEGHNNENYLMLQNIEALSHGEITVVGCKPMKKATCYVFDGNGQLVDRRKNQYPGN